MALFRRAPDPRYQVGNLFVSWDFKIGSACKANKFPTWLRFARDRRRFEYHHATAGSLAAEHMVSQFLKDSRFSIHDPQLPVRNLGRLNSAPGVNAIQQKTFSTFGSNEIGHVRWALTKVGKRDCLHGRIGTQAQGHGFRAERAEPEIFRLLGFNRIELPL
jgi:hypothetical protein